MSHSIGQLLSFGRLMLAAVQALTSKFVKGAKATFLKTQGELEEAERQVVKTDAVVEKAFIEAEAADEAQDRATLELATKLSGDGFGRTNPFKAFDAPSPSELCAKGQVPQANLLLALAPKVAQHPDASAASKKAAAHVAATAKTMRTAAIARTKALKARAAAVDARDALMPATQQALTALREALRYADRSEGTSTYDDVFGAMPKPKVKKKNDPAPVS